MKPTRFNKNGVPQLPQIDQILNKMRQEVHDADTLANIEEAWHEKLAFIRSVKDGPASLLSQQAQFCLVHLGEDVGFRAAFKFVDAAVTEALRKVIADEMSERKDSKGFMEGGSYASQEVMRHTWAERRREAIKDYQDLIFQWERGRHEL